MDAVAKKLLKFAPSTPSKDIGALWFTVKHPELGKKLVLFAFDVYDFMLKNQLSFQDMAQGTPLSPTEMEGKIRNPLSLTPCDIALLESKTGLSY